MYDTLKRFGVLRWAGEDGENWMYLWKNPGYIIIPLLVNIAIQMVCLWPVGILNLVGHNEEYWLTSNIIVSTYKVPFFTFYYYYFFFTITHSPLNHTVQIHSPCTAFEIISLKFMDNFFITVGGQVLALHCVILFSLHDHFRHIAKTALLFLQRTPQTCFLIPEHALTLCWSF